MKSMLSTEHSLIPCFIHEGALLSSSLTLSTGKKIEVLCAGVEYALELQLTQLAIVHNVIGNAVVQWIAGCWQLDGTALSKI